MIYVVWGCWIARESHIVFLRRLSQRGECHARSTHNARHPISYQSFVLVFGVVINGRRLDRPRYDCGVATAMEFAVPLIRVRHGALITALLSVLVFVTGFFAYYVGAFAGPLVLLPSVVIFFRCESWELLRYGLHPCFGAMCGMSPFSEIYTARFALILGLFVTLGSAVASIVALFNTKTDWMVALQICCLAFSVICILAAMGTMASLQNALMLAGMTETEFVEPAAPPTHPNYYSPHRVIQPQPEQMYEEDQYIRSPQPVQFYRPTRSPRPVQARYHDPYD